MDGLEIMYSETSSILLCSNTEYIIGSCELYSQNMLKLRHHLQIWACDMTIPL